MEKPETILFKDDSLKNTMHQPIPTGSTGPHYVVLCFLSIFWLLPARASKQCNVIGSVRIYTVKAFLFNLASLASGLLPLK